MKKIGLIVMAVLVTVMFASVSMAAISTSCNSCAKPCGVCSKQPCTCKAVSTCPQRCGMPYATCGSCSSCMKRSCAKPCATPCGTCQKPVCMEYKRDVLGNRVPVYTNLEGDAHNDTATGYEDTLVSGQ